MKVSTKHKDRLIVKKLEARELSQGKIFVANIEGDLVNTYEVLESGNECTYQPGDKVFIKPAFVSNIEFQGQTFGSVKDVEIIGYLKNEVTGNTLITQ